MQPAAAWLTVNVCPAIVAVPVRALVTVFAATESATVPLPLPLAPLVIVSHEALLVAVQEQPARLVTATLFASPAATALVDPSSGLLVPPGTPGAMSELFKVEDIARLETRMATSGQTASEQEAFDIF